MPVVTAAITQSTGPEQLTRGDGGYMGISTTEPVGFYGRTAAQTSGAAQAAVVRGNAAGIVATYATTQSPGSVASNSTLEASMTVIGATWAAPIAAGDFLYVNKPTAQAGLGVGNVRVSASNVIAVQFANLTTASITATATEKYAVVAIRGLTSISQTFTPAAVASASATEQQFNVTGLRTGETVQVIKPTNQAGLTIAGCRVVSAGVLGITYLNCTATATPITPTSEAYTIWTLPGLDALGNDIQVGATFTSPASVISQAVVEQSVTVTGLATTDLIRGISKPSITSNIGIANARVSAANTLAVAYVNASATLGTPTAADVLAVAVYRPNPVAPALNYQATLTPVSVASNTTAEQAFTVTGLITNTPVWVNKPSATPGLGITGVRVSGTNSLAITYCNTTGAAITPPAETYQITNFQIPIPDAGNVWMQTASQLDVANNNLLGAIRSAMVGMGQIAGA